MRRGAGATAWRLGAPRRGPGHRVGSAAGESAVGRGGGRPGRVQRRGLDDLPAHLRRARPRQRRLPIQADMAAGFTSSGPDTRALVTFDAAVFPGAGSPTEVPIGFRRGSSKPCDVDTCVDAKKAARCLTGSRITVDALDERGERGGVVLVNGTCARYLLRIY